MTDEQCENMIVLFETNDEDLGEFLGFDLEFEALFNFSNERERVLTFIVSRTLKI